MSGERIIKALKRLGFMEVDSLFDYLFIERRLEDLCNDGRLKDLYYPLYRVTPIKYRYVIEEYLKSEGNNKIALTLNSIECDVFEALLAVLDNNPETNWVSTNSVTDAYNKTHDGYNQISSKKVYEKLRELGFKPYRNCTARGFNISTRTVEKLEKRYKVRDLQQTSLLSHTPVKAS